MIVFLLRHLNVQNLESQIEGVRIERDKIFRQLVHSYPFETL